MIKPTVGRIVWYRHRAEDDQPLASIVTFVHSDDCVNLATFAADGSTLPRERVPLVQDDDIAAPGQCMWMPYQKGQAAKADALEQAAKAGGMSLPPPVKPRVPDDTSPTIAPAVLPERTI